MLNVKSVSHLIQLFLKKKHLDLNLINTISEFWWRVEVGLGFKTKICAKTVKCQCGLRKDAADENSRRKQLSTKISNRFHP